MTNRQFSALLRQMSAAYLILGENRFKIIAYDKAADSIEHLTSELKDYWDDGKLNEIPGVGKAIAQHIDEYFKTGKIKHFDETLSKLPQSIYPLLLVPGIGPKKAYRLVTELKLTNQKTVIEDLKKAALAHKIAPMEGFGEKSEQVILSGIEQHEKGMIKENRLALPEADRIAKDVIAFLKKHPAVERVDVLGSLRRKVATIGDVDLACASKKPKDVIDHFVSYPHEKIIDQGERGATMVLHNGRQVDLRVQDPSAYGAMLQYFTGSKHHNITLRSMALEKGLSLSEHGIKSVKTGKITTYKTEESFYEAVGLPLIPPELREDRGEIEAAKAGTLPDLVTLKDIKGDIHIHTNYEFPTSHDLGGSDIEEHLDAAVSLGYEYIGVSDHNPKMLGLTEKEIAHVMQKRYDWYKKRHENWKKKASKNTVELFVMCEIDILVDGKLALPESAFEFVDAAIVSVHSSFTQDRNKTTDRILRAINQNKKVRVIGHPTGRLLSRREGIDADWKAVMDACVEKNVAMEINSYPDRLDLPDALVKDAIVKKVPLVINTDSHAVAHMQLMEYGVSVARRGWATKRDIVNTLRYNQFSSWLLKRKE